MTGRTAAGRTMTRECPLGIAVAAQAKVVKARLDSDLEIRARTAMAMDAGIEPSPVRIVVVAGQAIDGRVLRMIEVQGRTFSAGQHRLTERHTGSARDEEAEREERGGDDARDEG